MRVTDVGTAHILLITSNRALSYVRCGVDGLPGDLVTIAEAPDMETALAAPSLAVQGDASGGLWNRTEASTNWSPTGVFIAYSHDGGATWSAPREISGRQGDGISALGFDAGGGLHLFSGSGRFSWGGRYHTVSTDGGIDLVATCELGSDPKG